MEDAPNSQCNRTRLQQGRIFGKMYYEPDPADHAGNSNNSCE